MADQKRALSNGKAPQMAPPDTLTNRIQRAAIGNQLRRMFNDVAAEPVPDEFTALLDALERKELGQ